jgi:hypothetical protein
MCAFAALVFLASAAAVRPAFDPAEGASRAAGIASVAGERAALGLNADRGRVARLVGSARDVGTRRWGIAMTAAEARVVDIPRRMAFADALHAELIPYAESLPGYAGGWIDQHGRARVVIELTGAHPAAEARLRRLVPAGGTLEIGRVTPAAAHEAGARVASDAPMDIACAAADCAPLRPGALVRAGRGTRGYPCAMGFHVTVAEGDRGGDLQFLTAGHCARAPTSLWFHRRLGQLGYEQRSLWGANGIDAMRVQLPDRLASHRVARERSVVAAARNPFRGEFVCVALPVSGRLDCGIVVEAETTWRSWNSPFEVHGARADGFSPVPLRGESGAPIVTFNARGSAIAVGLLDTDQGHFARMGDVLDELGVSLYLGERNGRPVSRIAMLSSLLLPRGSLR